MAIARAVSHFGAVSRRDSCPSPPHRIREWRERLGLTQAQLGERVGRSATEISRFERGERDLYLRDLKAIATAMGLDAGRLLNREDNQGALEDDQLAAVRAMVDDSHRTLTALSRVAETMRAYEGGPADPGFRLRD